MFPAVFLWQNQDFLGATHFVMLQLANKKCPTRVSIDAANKYPVNNGIS